jgi:hypothetical protein
MQQQAKPTTRRTASRRPEHLLELGDRLLRRGNLRSAASAYVRCADAWLAETILDQARGLVSRDPLQALKALSQVERLVGATGEGRRLTARAYERLGQPEIAQRFLLAVE